MICMKIASPHFEFNRLPFHILHLVVAKGKNKGRNTIYIYIYIYVCMYIYLIFKIYMLPPRGLSTRMGNLPHTLKCNSYSSDLSSPVADNVYVKRYMSKKKSFTYDENYHGSGVKSAGFRSRFEVRRGLSHTEALWYNGIVCL